MTSTALIARRPLSGPQKAAVLMLASGEVPSARILGLLAESELRAISAAMATLGPVTPDTIEQVCAEFAHRLGGAAVVTGDFENTERVLLGALPRDRAAQIMDDVRSSSARTMWDRLGAVNDALLVNYLKNEYPQTVALILSRIRHDQAARVLAQLPEGLAMEVVMRMLRMESVQPEVLDGVERTLQSEFMASWGRGATEDAFAAMAEIFNNLDRQAEARFLGALEERNREVAERIKALMFTFDDLQRLTPQAVQAILRAVEKDKLPIALKGASEKLRALFLSNLPERAGKMLIEDMEALGPVRLRDVDEAQGAIVALAKDLAAQGTIELRASKDEEMVY